MEQDAHEYLRALAEDLRNTHVALDACREETPPHDSDRRQLLRKLDVLSHLLLLCGVRAEFDVEASSSADDSRPWYEHLVDGMTLQPRTSEEPCS